MKSLATRRTLLPAAGQAIKVLDRLSQQIIKAPTLQAVEAIADRAAGYQRMFKPVNEVADRAGEVWIEAETRIGEELAKLPPATGMRGLGRPKLGGPKREPPKNQIAVAELGLAKKRAARARKLAGVRGQQKRLIAELKQAGKAVTPAAILVAVRQEIRKTKKHKVSTAAFSAAGPFDVVVIDPPWPMQKIDRDERPNQDAFDYPTMTSSELEEFWKKEMAARINPDCHLFCWTTQKHLPTTFDLIKAWGFRYVLVMVWHKPGGFQPLDLPQYNCEFAVYGRRGSPLFIDTKDFNCCFEAPRREHSRKPRQFYELIKRVTGGSRVDVFAREAHDGFAQFGNETGKFGRATEAAE